MDKTDFEDKKAKGDAGLKAQVNNILDMSDLNKLFPKLKNMLLNIRNYDELLNKEKLSLRFHQQGIVSKVIEQYNSGSKHVLIGAKPRAGKSYICGSIITNLKPKNVMILTPAPSETKSQFLDDLFGSHLDFNDYTIIDLNGKTVKTLRNILGKKNIIVSSKQFLDKKVDSNIIQELNDLHIDIVCYDENHEGGCTKISKDILDNYTKDSFKIFMTATYAKPMDTWEFSEDDCMFWSMEDASKAKNMHKNINYFKNKFGSNCFDDWDISDLSEYYNSEPELCLLSTMFQEDYYSELCKELGNDSEYGLSMKALFQINNKNTDFINPSAMRAFIDRIGGRTSIKPDNECMINRIKTIMEEKNSCRQDNFYTQLWFLPFGAGNTIDTVSQLTKKYIEQHRFLGQYEVLIVNSTYSDVDNKQIKDDIYNKGIEARKNSKKGLIVLVGKKCVLGITLKMCDVVMLFNSVQSSDKIMQMLYRCMTDDYENGKRVGIVVDMDMHRVLNTILYYGDNTTMKDEEIEKRIRYVSENLINIDYDKVFKYQTINHEELIDKLVTIWRSYMALPYSNYINRISNFDIDLDSDDKKLLKNFNKSSCSSSNTKIKINADNDQEVNDGINIESVKLETTIPDNEDQDSDEEDNDLDISFTRDILTHIIPFTVFMTIDTNDMDIHEMLDYIGKDEKLKAIFNEQCKTWWG
jgi:hypothetical protein